VIEELFFNSWDTYGPQGGHKYPSSSRPVLNAPMAAGISLAVDGVALGLPAHRDDRDVVANLEVDQVAHWPIFRKSQLTIFSGASRSQAWRPSA